MVINIIGDCDKRPVLYTVMKICQTLGDVLLVSNSTRLIRLSNTRESYGHYQNTMVAITQDGIDDFFENFEYDLEDFEYTIVDNIPLAEADLVIYVEGLIQSEGEMDVLEYIDDYKTIKLYKGHLLSANTLYNLECFEAYENMQPIGQKVAEAVSKIMAEAMDKDPKMITEIAMLENPAPDKSGNRAKKGLLGRIGKR